MTKRALITGITGQDGAYLAEFLLAKGYEVHGIKRRASLINTQRIDHLYIDPHVEHGRLHLHYGDMTDGSSLLRTVQAVKPHEIYNLAAQSHVAVSFEEPEYTAESDAVGTLRLLEAIRNLGMENDCRFYQASTSELFGKVQASCSITSRRCVVKPLSRVKSRAGSRALPGAWMSVFISATWMRAVTGDMHEITWKLNG